VSPKTNKWPVRNVFDPFDLDLESTRTPQRCDEPFRPPALQCVIRSMIAPLTTYPNTRGADKPERFEP
jgi:hypothetical protein